MDTIYLQLGVTIYSCLLRDGLGTWEECVMRELEYSESFTGHSDKLTLSISKGGVDLIDIGTLHLVTT